jgi:hypothetical protein
LTHSKKLQVILEDTLLFGLRTCGAYPLVKSLMAHIHEKLHDNNGVDPDFSALTFLFCKECLIRLSIDEAGEVVRDKAFSELITLVI